MTYKEAIKMRDEVRQLLIDKPYKDVGEGWTIRDVIVASATTVGNVYNKMWEAEMNNETALSFFTIKDDEYNVFVISHQWSWGSGDLYFEKLDSYKKANPF